MADNLRSKCNVDKHDEYIAAVKKLELQNQETDAWSQENYLCTIKKLELLIQDRDARIQDSLLYTHLHSNTYNQRYRFANTIVTSPTKPNKHGFNFTS